ncbi:type VI secretion system baseplate subunit TssG [Neorhodopirellula lusitana]|uniref:type VI secretion system baseplate subunit TssG n=1 Tax=Neorhodopirellula lusitana TaxID=445327 RepID=UPI003850F68B
MTSSDSTATWEQRLTGELGKPVQSLDFFQAMRRIEAESPTMPRVGHARQTGQEAVRIRQTTAIDFAPATIDRIDSGHDNRAHISQRFFGLLGPGGPMPMQVTETVRHETRHNGDPTLESFLNIFHHRMATLFYRAWSSSRGAVQRDRPDSDRFAAYVGSISGTLNSETETNGEASSDANTGLYFSGRFGSSHRNAEGLAAVVSATVHADANVKTFRLRHLRLEPEDRTLLSRSRKPSGRHDTAGRGGRLGQSVVLGRSVPDRRSMIDLDIGPIAFDLFQELLPGGESHGTLRNLIRSYVDPGLDCRVRLILDRKTIPRLSLGRVGALGRSAWVHGKAPRADVGDCQFIL